MGPKKSMIAVAALLLLSLLIVDSASAATRTVKLYVPGCE